MKPALRRIAYVLQVFPKYSETFIASELAELRRRGVELRIVALQAPTEGVRHDIIDKAGLDQITCYEKKDFPRILREFGPQLLHAHFATEATATALDLAAELDLPFTFTTHGYDIHRKAPTDLSARAATARAVVTVSQANAHYLAQHFAVPPSHIRVIHCGVDTQFFQPATAAAGGNQSGGQTPKRPLILCVARHVEVKNLAVLLQSCALLRDRNQPFHCVLLGDGPCRAELEKAQAELRLEHLVDMLGPAEQAQVRDWWQRASIGVLSSDNEGMPVSLMEAAACGVPVVATAVGGVPELVQHGETGFLVPPQNPEALASALAELLQNSELRGRLGPTARQRAEERFSVARQVDQLMMLWSEIITAGGPASVFVNDPFNAITDLELPTLALALDPFQARHQLKRHLLCRSDEAVKFRLKAIRVLHHKPGRRCVLEYETIIQRPGLPSENSTLIGKVRVRRFGKEGFRLQQKLWQAGFDSHSPDLISVPEPIGVIPRFQMWLQRKVPGATATRMLPGPQGVELSRRIADAIHKVHQAAVPTLRHHGMADELRVLHECLTKVGALRPEWNQRLRRIAAACDDVGAGLKESRTGGIHRDFYPAQVIVSTDPSPGSMSRLYLLDFDLYCIGDPGLDVGNFIGHMTEQSLRELGDPHGLAKQEQALEDRFVELSGEEVRPSVKAYTNLTLVRHIYLSAQFSTRQPFTAALIDLCEQRLGIAS